MREGGWPSPLDYQTSTYAYCFGERLWPLWFRMTAFAELADADEMHEDQYVCHLTVSPNGIFADAAVSATAQKETNGFTHRWDVQARQTAVTSYPSPLRSTLKYVPRSRNLSGRATVACGFGTSWKSFPNSSG